MLSNDDDSDNSDDSNDSYFPNKVHVQTSGKTALHFAACEIYLQMLELLLEKGANPNAADVHSRVSLVKAAL
jgi:ankyrin repeat protein